MRLPQSPGDSPGERRVGQIAEFLQAHILRHPADGPVGESSSGRSAELLHDVLIDNGLKSVERLLVRLQEAAALDGFGVVELEEEVVDTRRTLSGGPPPCPFRSGAFGVPKKSERTGGTA